MELQELGSLLAAVGDGLVKLGHAFRGLALLRVDVGESHGDLLPFLTRERVAFYFRVFLGPGGEATTEKRRTSVGSAKLWVPAEPLSRRCRACGGFRWERCKASRRD